ncbi:MAG: substrate-binding domain-containing protein [Planctomycetes bacterium]|nr:substrate-binding domain-containing protein [Planctomycetota bacterium]
MITHRLVAFALVASLAVLASACGADPAPSRPVAPPAPAPAPHVAVHVRLVTTTSVQDSGLLAAILPEWERATGDVVDVIALGTGAAFKSAKDGNADLLLVHDKKGEEEFIASGDGVGRTEFLWNSFEILGPASDPAQVKGVKSAPEALKRIAAADAKFVSRGDDSGTHRREKSLWEKAGGRPTWAGYREAGQGMGPTLRIADETDAYVLCDQGTRYGYKGALRLTSLLAATPELRNVYSVVRLNVAKHTHVKKQADDLAAWLLTPETAKRIEAFQVNGNTLFNSLRLTPPAKDQ